MEPVVVCVNPPQIGSSSSSQASNHKSNHIGHCHRPTGVGIGLTAEYHCPHIHGPIKLINPSIMDVHMMILDDAWATDTTASYEALRGRRPFTLDASGGSSLSFMNKSRYTDLHQWHCVYGVEKMHATKY